MTQTKSASQRLLLFALSLALVMIGLDITVVNVALESIQSSLGTNIAGLQWVLNAYTLSFACLLLTAGALCDRLGPKLIMVCGLVLFTLASLACGLSNSIESLVVARLVQGIAAALCTPSSLALLHAAYVHPKERAKAIGVWSGTASVAMGAGPIVGGFMIEHFGWPSIFLINLPIGIIGIWLILAVAPAATKTTKRNLDFLGQALAIIALAALTTGVIEGGTLGWTHPIVVSGFIGFIAIGACFLAVEMRQHEPMLAVSLFHSAAVNVTTIIGLLLSFGYYGLMFAISLFFQVAKGYHALAAGLAFLPMTAVLSVTNIAAGALCARFGGKIPILAGLAIAALGYFSLAPLDANTPYLFIMFPLIVVGIGMALAVPSINIVLLENIGGTKVGTASGVLNAARQIGGIIGVGVFGSLLAGSSNELLRGIRIALILSGVGMVAGFIIAVIGLRERAKATASV